MRRLSTPSFSLESPPRPHRYDIAMNRPNIFISRRIPKEGLDAIRAECEVDLWPDQLPPPYDELRARVKNCDGLVSLLTDRIDAALLDASPKLKVVSNFAVGFNNVDVAACTARGVRRQHARRTDRRHRGHGRHSSTRGRAAAHRKRERCQAGPLVDLGTARLAGARPRRGERSELSGWAASASPSPSGCTTAGG